jgi:hypothetical protein
MTTSTHTTDTPDTVEAILAGQLLPSMRAWALLLGNKDRDALLSFLAGAPAGNGRRCSMTTSTTTPRNRREADALARLLALLADGVAFDTAVWSVTDQGREMDTARLVDLFDGHRRTSAAPGAPVATPATSASATPGPWRYVWPCVIANVSGDSVEVALCRSAAVGSVEVADANGRLIAAAPELLQALRAISDDYEDRFDLDDPSTNPGIKLTIKQARAAITKAEGGAA